MSFGSPIDGGNRGNAVTILLVAGGVILGVLGTDAFSRYFERDNHWQQFIVALKAANDQQEKHFASQLADATTRISHLPGVEADAANKYKEAMQLYADKTKSQVNKKLADMQKAIEASDGEKAAELARILGGLQTQVVDLGKKLDDYKPQRPAEAPNQPVAPPPIPPPPVAANDGDDSSQAASAVLGAATTAVCVAQPELCPFAMAFSAILGSLFKGDPEFVERAAQVMLDLSMGKRPSDEQIKALADAAGKSLATLSPDERQSLESKLNQLLTDPGTLSRVEKSGVGTAVWAVAQQVLAKQKPKLIETLEAKMTAKSEYKDVVACLGGAADAKKYSSQLERNLVFLLCSKPGTDWLKTYWEGGLKAVGVAQE